MGTSQSFKLRATVGLAALVATVVVVILVVSEHTPGPSTASAEHGRRHYKARKPIDSSGYGFLSHQLTWPHDATLEEIAAVWTRPGHRMIEQLDRELADRPEFERFVPMLLKASMYHYEGEPKQAYAVLEQMRELAERSDPLAEEWLYTIVFFQGVTGLRVGENENCVRCRGRGACLLPIAPEAVHAEKSGSQLAVKHFTEYLEQFPDDLEVRWLLNLAQMTLGEYPGRVDPRFRIDLGRFTRSEFDIGWFPEVSDAVGLAGRLNWAGGAIMEDFDGDGLLDLVVTASDPTQAMAFYRNKGDGTFEDRTKEAGLDKQTGGLYCVQTDFDNDGRPDIFVARGGWLTTPMRPSLLRNNGDGTFTDATAAAGLLAPVNVGAAQWADYDNDGRLDLFIACEAQPNKLYHNVGNGKFEEVAVRAGVVGRGEQAKGCTWIDYDQDGYPDLFVNNTSGTARLYHNNRDGTFADATVDMLIDGPRLAFSCMAFDYDNDGWPDILATCFDRTLGDVVKGMVGEPHGRESNRLFRNLGGKGFKDVTKEVGLDLVFSAMGSNYADFDNDGFLDFYLATGEPKLSTLIPNRMFKNVAGKRFAEITGTSGTGHLQKGHGVAIGDWRRTGSVDLFVETGGTVPGDRYHNLLFLNPGQGNNWLNVKLVGKTTNTAAIGARIKVVTAGPNPRTVCRWVSSGSSFGANPLEQSIGLGKDGRVAMLEVYWPTTGTTQTFRDVAANQFIEVTESAAAYRKREVAPIILAK